MSQNVCEQVQTTAKTLWEIGEHKLYAWYVCWRKYFSVSNFQGSIRTLSNLEKQIHAKILLSEEKFPYTLMDDNIYEQGITFIIVFREAHSNIQQPPNDLSIYIVLCIMSTYMTPAIKMPPQKIHCTFPANRLRGRIVLCFARRHVEKQKKL